MMFYFPRHSPRHPHEFDTVTVMAGGLRRTCTDLSMLPVQLAWQESHRQGPDKHTFRTGSAACSSIPRQAHFKMKSSGSNVSSSSNNKADSQHRMQADFKT
jgi:hypothetical protein